MEPCTIGDITLSEDGDRLRLTIDEEEPFTWWTVAGARMAVEALQAWIREQESYATSVNGGADLCAKTPPRP